jgi:hypothetical protein
MRGWETKYEWEGTGRGAGNEFRVEGSLGMRQRTVRSVSSLELLVSVNPSKNSTHFSIPHFFDLPMLASQGFA